MEIVIIISLSVIGYLSYQLLKAHNKRIFKVIANQNREIRKLQENSVGLTSLNTKTINTLEKMSQKTKNRLDSIDGAISELIAGQSMALKGMIDFVYDTLNTFKTLHCDLYDDCDVCPFEHLCERMEDSCDDIEDIKNIEAEEIVKNDCKDEFKDSSIAQLPPMEGMIEIDPSNKDDLQKLSETLKRQGLPKEAIDAYMSYIDRIPKGRKIKVGVSHQMISSDGKSVQPSKKPIINKEDKLIDPDSKIVKTLNRIFESDQ